VGGEHGHPGMFCEAIVTRNSGSPTPTRVGGSNRGAAQLGAGHDDAHHRHDECGWHRPRPGEPTTTAHTSTTGNAPPNPTGAVTTPAETGRNTCTSSR